MNAAPRTWNVERNPVQLWHEMLTRIWSPYETNPFNYNPLRSLLERIDFDGLRHDPSAARVFICATNVRTGLRRIFENEELSADVLLASAALPHVYQAVEIDGEPYWDGGYSGNPTLWPMIAAGNTRDLIVVRDEDQRADGSAVQVVRQGRGDDESDARRQAEQRGGEGRAHAGERRRKAGLQRFQHSLLMTVCSVDHQNVDPSVEQCLGPNSHIAVDPDRRADHQPPIWIQSRAIQGRAQRMLPRHHPEKLSVFHHERHFEVPVSQLVEDLGWRRLRSDRQQVTGHHLVHLGESIDAGSLDLAHRAQRLSVLHHHRETVRSLRDQRECLAYGGVRRYRDRRVVDRVRSLDLTDHFSDDVSRNVLGHDSDSPAARYCLSHAPTGDRGHVGHDQGQRGTDSVGAPQVHVNSRGDC